MSDAMTEANKERRVEEKRREQKQLEKIVKVIDDLKWIIAKEIYKELI